MGRLLPQRSLFSRFKKSDGKSGDTNDPVVAGPLVSANALLEEDWDFKEPLVLLGPNVEEDPNKSLKASIPRLSFISFDDFRVRFGPGLKVQVKPVTNLPD